MSRGGGWGVGVGGGSSNLPGKFGKFSKEKLPISKKKGPKFDFLTYLLIKLVEI